MSSLLPTPLPFWPKNTQKPSNDSWLQWRKTFEDYIELLPILSPTIVLDVPSKLKLLRTNLGESGQRYFDALNLHKAIDLHTAFSKLESAWGGKDNVFLSRYRFCQMCQESNQCVSDFITNLTLAIQDCGYKEIKADNFEPAMLVQQLIVGLRDEKARENLLSEKKDLSWEKACDIASHRERVRQNLQQLNQSNDGVIASLESEMAVSLVNTAVSSPKQRPSAPSKQLPSCYRCGQHHIRWSDCRHQKTVCQFCKKVGHIERVCFSNRRANTNTHATYPNPAGDGEAILRMFSANAPLQSPYTITLPVDHHPVKFEIDTGSAVTLINEASLPKLPSLLPASSTFRSYTGQNVDVRGVFTAEVEHDGELHYLPVHVVRGSQQPNLLGRNWIKCVPSVPSYVHRIGVNPALDSILVNHKDLFLDDTTTHYRGPPVQFQFQSDFRPRFFKARTVPYALAPKVEEELDRLQKADIIEPVQYSEWAAPIVPVLKTDGSVRICGDYKLTINSATKLNPYPLPRIEDLYRITPNDSIGASPAELMFKRQLRTRLDLLNPSTQDRVIAKQTKMKERYDVNTRPRVVAPNESVYTRLEHETNWCPAVVRTSEGQIVEFELEDGRIVRRHLDQVRSRTDTASREFGKFELPATLDRDPDIPRTEPLLPAQSTTPPTETFEILQLLLHDSCREEYGFKHETSGPNSIAGTATTKLCFPAAPAHNLNGVKVEDVSHLRGMGCYLRLWVQPSLKADTEIVILPADKSRSTVILDKVDYRHKALLLLNDRESYKVSDAASLKSLVATVIRILARLKKDKVITVKDWYMAKPAETAMARFYGLTKTRDQREVLVTKALPGADGWNDHRLVISRMRICLQSHRRPQGKRPRVADAAAAAAASADADENASVEDRLCQLRSTVQSTALALLGFAHSQHQDWFDDNDIAISNPLAEKNRLHKTYPNRPTDDNSVLP
nr:unnamed protein product [Spirometra erinaceieuropaei]